MRIHPPRFPTAHEHLADDFEKGEADGAHAALELVAAMIERLR